MTYILIPIAFGYTKTQYKGNFRYSVNYYLKL